jgi:hypothetical protein
VQHLGIGGVDGQSQATLVSREHKPAARHAINYRPKSF